MRDLMSICAANRSHAVSSVRLCFWMTQIATFSEVSRCSPCFKLPNLLLVTPSATSLYPDTPMFMLDELASCVASSPLSLESTSLNLNISQQYDHKNKLLWGLGFGVWGLGFGVW